MVLPSCTVEEAIYCRKPTVLPAIREEFACAVVSMSKFTQQQLSVLINVWTLLATTWSNSCNCIDKR